MSETGYTAWEQPAKAVRKELRLTPGSIEKEQMGTLIKEREKLENVDQKVAIRLKGHVTRV